MAAAARGISAVAEPMSRSGVDTLPKSIKAAHPMEDHEDPLKEFGLDAIDLRWTMKDIASKRWWIVNQTHVERLIELGLVEMRDEKPVLTIAGQNAIWAE